MLQSALSKKMGIKPSARLLLVNAPAGFIDELLPLPALADVVGSGPAEAVMLFCERKADLEAGLAHALEQVAEGGHLWVCYPKGKTKEPRDLTRDVGWDALEGKGLDSVNLIAVNDSWSAFKFRRTGREQPTDAELLAGMFAGSKAGARPIHDQVVAAARKLGNDVEMSTRKTYVALARGKQFALLSPGAGGRLDVGLKLKGHPTGSRLTESPEFGSGSISHKVTLRDARNVDDEFLRWLRIAYESTGRG